jgi:pimeloyl-ACP methyl ester carboxylesterase
MILRRSFLAMASFAPLVACSALRHDAHAPIEWDGSIPIGGIEQWVAIRGRDRSRPAILFLHGGPCETQSPFLSLFAPWEERYVVAQWDQRGAGLSFQTLGAATPEMTLDQIVQDAGEIAQFVTGQLGVSKLILVGHSWGAIVGLGAVRARPDLFHAFVATGLPIHGGSIIERMRMSAVARATAAGDAEAVAQLNALTATDLADMSKLGVVFRWAEPFPDYDASFIARQNALRGSADNPASPAAAAWFSARSFCLPTLMPAVLSFDAASDTNVPVPFLVIQGRGDTRTPFDMARAYFDQVRAPAKRFAAIDGGHFACFTNTQEFLDAMDRGLRDWR